MHITFKLTKLVITVFNLSISNTISSDFTQIKSTFSANVDVSISLLHFFHQVAQLGRLNSTFTFPPI